LIKKYPSLKKKGNMKVHLIDKGLTSKKSTPEVKMRGGM